jgi:hypothetical protein
MISERCSERPRTISSRNDNDAPACRRRTTILATGTRVPGAQRLPRMRASPGPGGAARGVDGAAALPRSGVLGAGACAAVGGARPAPGEPLRFGSTGVVGARLLGTELLGRGLLGRGLLGTELLGTALFGTGLSGDVGGNPSGRRALGTDVGDRAVVVAMAAKPSPRQRPTFPSAREPPAAAGGEVIQRRPLCTPGRMTLGVNS